MPEYNMNRVLKFILFILSSNIIPLIVFGVSVKNNTTTAEGIPIFLGIWILYVIIDIPLAMICIFTLDHLMKIICIGFIQGLFIGPSLKLLFILATNLFPGISAVLLFIIITVLASVISFAIPYYGVQIFFEKKNGPA